jgi:hypothetical protein
MSNHLIKRLFIILLGAFFSFSISGCKPADLDIANLFSEKYLAVEKDGMWGYIDLTGREVIDFFYDAAGAFRGDCAVVSQNNRYFLIDKEGKRVFEGSYEYLEFDFETELLWFFDDGKQGLMNSKGEIICEATYDLEFGPTNATSFNEGLAKVKLGDKYGFINSSGEEVIPLTFDDADSFSQGLAVVKTGSNYGYIGPNGEVSISAAFYNANSFNLMDQAVVSTYDAGTSTETFQVIDKSGATVFAGYDFLYETDYGYVGELSDLYYLIRPDGTKVDNVGYDDFNYFFDFIITLNETLGESKIYDSEWNVILTFTAETEPDDAFFEKEILYFAYTDDQTTELVYGSNTKTLTCDGIDAIINGKIVATKYGMRGVLDFSNKKILEFNYDSIDLFDDGFMLVSINGLYGIFDSSGKVLIPLRYDDCNTSIYI